MYKTKHFIISTGKKKKNMCEMEKINKVLYIHIIIILYQFYTRNTFPDQYLCVHPYKKKKI